MLQIKHIILNRNSKDSEVIKHTKLNHSSLNEYLKYNFEQKYELKKFQEKNDVLVDIIKTVSEISLIKCFCLKTLSVELKQLIFFLHEL